MSQDSNDKKGKGIFGNIDELLNGVADNPLGAISNVMTLGALEIGKDGTPKMGASFRAADEIVGGVTGRNLARDQAAAADARITAEDAAKKQQMLSDQARANQEEINLSRQIGAARQTQAAASINSKIPSASNTGGSLGVTKDEKDFLGL